MILINKFTKIDTNLIYCLIILRIMQNFRFTVVEKANEKRPIQITAPDGDTSSYYGCHIFNRAAMKK